MAQKQNENTSVFFITITALMTALVYVFTAFVNIKLPIAANGGLIHLGNVPLFIGAILFGRKVGAISGGVGMALFDLFSGWTVWAPFTLVTVGLMGYAVGLMCERKNGFGWYIVGISAACVIKVIGYYIAEAVIYQNLIIPVSSIPGNLVQIGCAAIAVLAIIVPLRKAVSKMFPAYALS